MKGTSEKVLWIVLGLVLLGILTTNVSSRRSDPPEKRSTKQGQLAHTSQPRLAQNYGKLPLSFELNKGQTDSQVKFLSRGRGYTMFLTGNEAVLSLRRPSAASNQPAATREGMASATASGHGFSRAGRGPLSPILGALATDAPVAQRPLFDVAALPRWFNLRAAEFKNNFALQEVEKPQGRTADPALHPAVLRIKLVGANPRAKVTGLDELPGKSNYFLGNDPKKWRTNVPNYAKVKYEDVYPGVDLVYYGKQGRLEYDFVVSPGADPSTIRLALERADALHLDAGGNLVAQINSDEVVLHKPVVYQQRSAVNGQQWQAESAANLPSAIDERRFLDGHYVLLADHRIGFKVGAYDHTQPLILDPILTYSSYLGGTGIDAGLRITADAAGNAYVAGVTTSTDFPATSGTLPSHVGAQSCYLPTTSSSRSVPCPDVFVTKLNPTGTALLYSTYLGGTGADFATGISVDASGDAIVMGSTASRDFPTTPGAFQTASPNRGKVFAAKLGPGGSTLVFSTYLGGSNDDIASAGTTDSSGSIYVTGITFSTDFPTTAGAYRYDHNTTTLCSYAGKIYTCPDPFVAKLNASATSLAYATYVGSGGDAVPMAIAVDATGNAYLTGLAPPFYPVTPGAYQTPTAGAFNAFVTKLNSTGTSAIYSTLLGGSAETLGMGIAADSAGNAYLAGATTSHDFPVASAFRPGFGGGSCGSSQQPFDCPDAFVTKLNPTGSAVVYSTYLGGSDYDIAFGITSDSNGNAYVTGATGSLDFPTASPVQAYFGGGSCAVKDSKGNPVAFSCPNAFLTRLNASGTATFSTYLGGAGGDIGFGVAADSSASAYLTGATISADFPTVTPIQGHLAGLADAFAVKIATSTGTGSAVTLSTTNLDFGQQPVGLASSLKTLTLSNTGDARLNITSITASGDFTQTNHCGSSLLASSSCEISVSFKPAAAGDRSGDLTITHDATGSPHKVALSGKGTDFSMTAAAGSSATATIAAGQTANYRLTLAPSGLSGSVSLGCEGAPRGATCAVSPASLTLDGSTPAEVKVSVQTTARSLAPPASRPGPPGLGGPPGPSWLMWLLLLLILSGATMAVRRRVAWGLAMLLVVASLWGACGGGGGSPPPPPTTGTPAGTYTLTVTATYSASSGTLSRSTALTLTVQ